MLGEGELRVAVEPWIADPLDLRVLLATPENERRRREGLARAQSLIDVDLDLLTTLRRADRDLGSVPADGER